MDIQIEDNQLTELEKRLYLLGAIIFVGLLLFTVIFSFLISQLLLLQLRLSILGIALIYYLVLYFYFTKFHLHKNIAKEEIVQNNYEIIIWFNGRELGRM